MPEKRTCVTCGSAFIGRGILYCSRKCRDQAKDLRYQEKLGLPDMIEQARADFRSLRKRSNRGRPKPIIILQRMGKL